MPGDRFLFPNKSAALIPRSTVKLPAFENLNDLTTLIRGKHHAAGVEQLEAVPLGRIVARGDLHAARSAELTNREAARRRRHDAKVEHLASRSQQPRQNRV